MTLDIVLLLGGLALLVVSADWLIEGASELAKRLGVPPFMIGLTLVACGTSAPELVVAIRATLQGAGGMALGNIVGSNIANVFLVMGLPGILLPLNCSDRGAVGNGIMMVAVTLLFIAIAYVCGALSQISGALFIAILLIYLVVIGSAGGFRNAESEIGAGPQNGGRILLLTGFGLMGLVVGSELLVMKASALTRAFGLRQEFIGLSVIAIGTSVPELATILAAVRRREFGVCFGNIIGSNIFNILAVGGAIGLIGGATFSPAIQLYDLPFMVLATSALAYLIFAKRKVGSLTYAGLFSVFLIYLYLLSKTARFQGLEM